MPAAGPDDLADFIREPARPLPLWARIAALAGAALAFVVGIVGWLIPVVTGVPFYALGLVLVAVASATARRWINRLERHFPGRWRRGLRAAAAHLPPFLRRLFDAAGD